MVDYTKWDEKPLSVATLRLDPKNPRIPSTKEPLDQRALIAELVEHDDVMGLARNIATDGWSRVESLVAFVDDDGKTYVLEGNRRLAALKILLNPESAPDSVQKTARKLSNAANHAAFTKVRVLIAPSRVDAAPLIMSKHTHDQIKKWAPLMQAQFYRRFAGDGIGVDELAKLYGTTPGDVRSFLRLDSAYALARLMPLPPEVKEDVDNPRRFNASALQRLIDFEGVRERLGIEFDGDAQVTGKDKDAFTAVFSRVISDIASGSQDTRTLNTAKDAESYVDGIVAELPKGKSGGGGFKGSDFKLEKDPAPASPTQPKPRKPVKKQRPSKSIVPRGTTCEVKNARIQTIFNELRLLQLDRFPNASAVLFRILLEMCVGHYLDKTKQIAPLLERERKQHNRKNDWYPPLSDLLNAIMADPNFDLHPLARKKLNRAISDAKSLVSIEGLDQYVHNKYTPPTVHELRAYWDTFEGLFDVTLTEPPPPAKPAKAS